MKQKLLLALLALFTEVGNLAAQTQWTSDVTNGDGLSFAVQYASPTTGDVRETWSNNPGSFDLNQSFTGIPEGVYELSAQAMYRASFEYGTPTNCVLYASVGDKTYSTPIANFGDYTANNNLAQIGQQMTNNGAYTNIIPCIIIKNGTVTIGMKNIGELTFCDNGYWFVWKNSTFSFKNVTESYHAKLLSRANSMLASAPESDAKDALNTAVANYATATANNVEELQNAINTFLGSSTASNPINVTSYLANPSFEEGGTTYWYQDLGYNQGNNRNIQQPTGWNLMYSSEKVNNTQYQSFIPQTDGAKDGSCLYVRHRWGDVKAIEDLRQSVKELPSGAYTLTVAVKGGSNVSDANTLTLTAGDNTNTITISNFNKTNYQDYSVSVNKDNDESTLDICYGWKQTAGNEQLYYVDDIRLFYLGDPVKAKIAELAALEATISEYLNNEEFNNVAGSERNALLSYSRPSVDDETVEAYQTLIENLQTTINAFVNAKPAYDIFATYNKELEYANQDKKPVIDNTTTATTLISALRAYYESHALAEGVEGAVNMTEMIANATDPTNNEGWTWNGSKNNPASNEPWTDANGTNTHSYFDGGNWGANSWTTTMEQNVTLAPGKYLLTAKARAAVNVTFTMAVGENSVNLPNFGGSGNVFDRGWGDASVEFETDGLAASTILVSASSQTLHEWFSISDFRLVQIEASTLSDEVIQALIATMPTGKMNAEVRNAMNEAKSTLEAEKSLETYNALVERINEANASVEAYIQIKSFIDYALSLSKSEADFAEINNAYENGLYADNTEPSEIFEQYQAIEIAALKANNAVDFTSVIINPSFETGDMTGWNAESRNDTGVKENSNGTYTTSNIDGNYLFNSWGGSAENNVYQTIKNLPAGTYQLSALVAGFPGEELVVAANETTSSVTVTDGKTVGYTVNVIFTLEEAQNVTIKASNTKAQSGSDASFIKADNFILKAYSDPLAALKEQLATLKEQASEALASEDYENVTGSEKTNLEGLVEATPEETNEAYNSAINNITEAIATFKNAKAAYDAFVAASDIEMPDLAYVSEDKRQQLNEACSAEPNTAEEAETATANITTALRAYYESHALAEGVEDAVIMTDKIANATDPTNNDGWTWTGSKNNPASNEPWTDADGTNTHSYFDGGNWNANSWTTTMKQSVTIPAGKYLLTAKGRSAENTTLTMTVGEASVQLPHVGATGNVFDRGWGDASVEFEADGNGSEIVVTATSNTIHEWFSICDFRLVQLEAIEVPMADADDYAALATAITTAEGNVLGFDADEYAPYNNVAALQALAAAKDINPEAEDGNTKEVVQNATAALTEATWTPNEEEVNAFFDGSFASEYSHDGNVMPIGWHGIGNYDNATNVRLMWDFNSNAGLNATSSKQGAFAKFTAVYGTEVGYTMPLKAGTYSLKFIYGGWNEVGERIIKVYNEDNEATFLTETNIKAKDNKAHTTVESWSAYNGFFTIPADGDYIFSFYRENTTSQNQLVFSDIEIKKANVIELNDARSEDLPGAAENAVVNLTRKFVNKWNPICLPFEVTDFSVFGENCEVVKYTGDEMSGDDHVTLKFETVTDKMEANVPYMVWIKEDADVTSSWNLTFTGVDYNPAEAPVSAGTNYDYVGVYKNYAKGTSPIATGDVILSSGTYKTVTGNGGNAIKGFRGYWKKNPSAAGAKSVSAVIDGQETDDIKSIELIEAFTEGVYNLQGQKVNHARKGVYIVNGKKVVVK